MADRDKIKAELELRVKRLERANAHPEVIKRVEGSIKAYKSMIEFIDSMEDEPMEEDLNKEIQRFSMNLAEQENGGEWLHDIMKTARHFAEWQKQQMEKKHSIEIASNCMRNYEEGKAAGYKRGCKETKEQMMANAIEAEVQSAGCFIPLITPKEYGNKIPNIKFGDTIKVILVKE